jgi:hypothetical protein
MLRIGAGQPRIRPGMGVRIGRDPGGVAAPAVLTGPLNLTDPGGEVLFSVDRACTICWSLTAPASTPDAAAIDAGTGALNAAFGEFAVGAGTVQTNIVFPSGINVTGAVLSIVARVGSTYSNILRDMSVDVNTASPITATFVNAFDAGFTPNFGTLPAGEYILALASRSGSAFTVTPPGEALISTAIASVDASTTNRVRFFRVTLAAQRSGNWTIGHSGAVFTASALWSLSGPSQTIAALTDFTTVAGLKTGSFANNTQADDIILAAIHQGGAGSGGANVPPDKAGDRTTSDAADPNAANSDHRWRVLRGTAAGGSPEAALVNYDIGVAGKHGCIAALILRKV